MIGMGKTSRRCRQRHPTGRQRHQSWRQPHAGRQEDEVDSKVTQFEELDLTLDEDLTLDDSPSGSAQRPGGRRRSAIDLTRQRDWTTTTWCSAASGAGSDITIGGDSGISLVDPADSGLSLEQPLDLGVSGEESLELGEDDMLTMAVERHAGVAS